MIDLRKKAREKQEPLEPVVTGQTDKPGIDLRKASRLPSAAENQSKGIDLRNPMPAEGKEYYLNELRKNYDPNVIESFFGGLSDSAYLGADDELKATFSKATGGDYKSERDRQRAIKSRQWEDNPNSYGSGQIVGDFLGTLLPMKYAAMGLKAAVPPVLSFVRGIGESEKADFTEPEPVDQIAQALNDGAYSGSIDLGLGLGVPALMKGGKVFKDGINNKIVRPAERTAADAATAYLGPKREAISRYVGRNKQIKNLPKNFVEKSVDKFKELKPIKEAEFNAAKDSLEVTKDDIRNITPPDISRDVADAIEKVQKQAMKFGTAADDALENSDMVFSNKNLMNFLQDKKKSLIPEMKTTSKDNPHMLQNESDEIKPFVDGDRKAFDELNDTINTLKNYGDAQFTGKGLNQIRRGYDKQLEKSWNKGPKNTDRPSAIETIDKDTRGHISDFLKQNNKEYADNNLNAHLLFDSVRDMAEKGKLTMDARSNISSLKQLGNQAGDMTEEQLRVLDFLADTKFDDAVQVYKKNQNLKKIIGKNRKFENPETDLALDYEKNRNAFQQASDDFKQYNVETSTFQNQLKRGGYTDEFYPDVANRDYLKGFSKDFGDDFYDKAKDYGTKVSFERHNKAGSRIGHALEGGGKLVGQYFGSKALENFIKAGAPLADQFGPKVARRGIDTYLFSKRGVQGLNDTFSRILTESAKAGPSRYAISHFLSNQFPDARQYLIKDRDSENQD